MVHVFNGSTKGVSHPSIFNRLFAEAKICQLYVTVGIKQDIFGLQISVRHTRTDFRIKVYPNVIMKRAPKLPINDALTVKMFQG